MSYEDSSPGRGDTPASQPELEGLFLEVAGKVALQHAVHFGDSYEPETTFRGLPLVEDTPWLDTELPGDKIIDSVPGSDVLIDPADTLVVEHSLEHFKPNLAPSVHLYVPQSVVLDYWKGSFPQYESVIQIEHRDASGAFRVYRRLTCDDSDRRSIEALVKVLPFIGDGWQAYDFEEEAHLGHDEFELIKTVMGKFDEIMTRMDEPELFPPSEWSP